MSQSSLRKTLTASLCNFLAAGAIVAGASGLSLWEKYLGLDGASLGWLNFFSANGCGAAIGAFFGGFIADRYGRSKVFSFNMLVYMVGMVLLFTSMNYAQLMLGTIVTGIAAGISIPASWTYICECSEPEKRGRNIAFSQLAWGLGPAFMMLFSYLLSPGGLLHNWGNDDVVVAVADWFGVRKNLTNEVNVFASRIVFFILYVIAFIAWILQRRLEPSTEWVANKDTIDRNQPLFFSLGLFFKKPYLKTVIILVGMYLSWNLVASTMGFFQNHIYENVGHLSSLVTTRTLSDMWFLTCAITFVGAFFIDRFNHSKLLAGFVDVGILAWLLVGIFGIDSMTGLVIITVLWGIQAGVSVQLFFALWSVELFPFRYRAAAVGVMVCIVRALSAFGGSTISDYFNTQGAEAVRYGSFIMLGLFVISAAIAIHCSPETRGKSMSQISDEMYGEDHTKEHYGE